MEPRTYKCERCGAWVRTAAIIDEFCPDCWDEQCVKAFNDPNRRIG